MFAFNSLIIVKYHDTIVSLLFEQDGLQVAFVRKDNSSFVKFQAEVFDLKCHKFGCGIGSGPDMCLEASIYLLLSQFASI